MAGDAYWGIEIKDWATIVAVIVGPILAVQAQRFVDGMKEKRERRLRVFRTLMSSRAERVSRDHVQALNMIDLEFYGRVLFGVRFQTSREKAVTNAWKNYNDHLNDKSFPTHSAWMRTCDDLITKLLYVMSQSLGYDFDEVQLKRDAYRPEAHVNLENRQFAVLEGLAKALSNEASLSVTVVPPENADQEAVTLPATN